jgi:prophage tail gpP-like protein
LRASAIWKSSSTVTLDVGGKQVSGWRVAERDTDIEWLVFELDGTLIAAQSPSDELPAMLAQLQPVIR